MNKMIFNATFLLGFILTFFIIINIFSGSLAAAFFPSTNTLAVDEQIDWNSCEQDEKGRSFNLTNEKKASAVTVLMYHKILDEEALDESHYNENGKLKETIVLTSEFQKQMKWLHDHDYVTLTAAEFQQFMENDLAVPAKSVLITFDDGFKNNYEEAYSILKKYQFTAIDFVITSRITTNDITYDPSGHQYLSVEDMEKSCDVFEYQSHTYDFHRRTEDGVAYLVDQTEESIANDMKASFVNLNTKNPVFSYPYGEYDKETLEAVKTAGASMAFSVEYKQAKPGDNMLEIPRKAVFPTDSIKDFEKKITEMY